MNNSHPEDSDLLSRPSLDADERAPDRETGTHHWSRVFRLNIVRDLKGEVLVSSHVAGETSLAHGPVRIRVAVCF